MASTSNMDINNSSVGAAIQGDHNTIENIHVHVNNPQLEVNESDFELPRLINTFHGREQEFKKLEDLFFSKNKNSIVLFGLPGYGKTELTKQFAKRCLKNKRVKRVFWIKSENTDELNKYSTCLRKIYNKYENQRCMFVFDNALNRRSICDFEPSNNNKHKVLITSHVKDWGHGVVPLLLEPLPSEPVVKIFKTILEENFRKEDRNLYLALGQTVDNVPLGVQIVAGYVRQGMQRLGQSFQLIDCVEEMKQSRHKIINDTFSKDNPDPYKNSIYGALSVSLQKIKEEEDIQRRELAATVLYVCAFLDPDEITSCDLLRILSIKYGNKISEIKLKSAIRILVNFSFLNYHGPYESPMNIHRLVQSYLRQYLSSCDCDLEDMQCYSLCMCSMFTNDYFNNSMLKYVDVSIVQECVEFLKKVFEIPNESGTKFIYDCDLYKFNSIQILEIFLQQTDFNKLNKNGHKVMHNVAQTWNVKAVELLIERGVEVNHKDAANRTPMDSLLSQLTSGWNVYRSIVFNPFVSTLIKLDVDIAIISTLTVLLNRGASFDKNLLSEESEFWLLYSALKIDNLNLLKSLIQKNINVNSRSRWRVNNSVLHEAAAGGNSQSIELLISHGADANAVNNYNETALFGFVQYILFHKRNIDKQKLCEILNLLNCEELANNTNNWGYILLHRAAHGLHKDLVSVLLETYGSEVNKQGVNGYTPLHALIEGLWEDSNKEEVVQIVQTLIRCGASLSIKAYRQYTPLQVLKMNCKLSGHNYNYLVPLLTLTTNNEPKRKNCTLL